MKMPKHRLEEECFFDKMVSVIKKIAPAVIQLVPGITKAIKPMVDDARKGTSRTESQFKHGNHSARSGHQRSFSHANMEAEWLRSNGQVKLIAKACKEVAYKLRDRTGPTRRITETPGRKKHTWSKELVTPSPATLPLPPRRCPPWELETEEHSRSQNIQLQARRNYEKAVKKHFEESWRKTWRKDQDSHSCNPTVVQISPLDHRRPRIHAELARAESSLCTQIRTEKIGFAAFLHKQRVPVVTSPACHCGWERQTAKYVILYCRLNDIKKHLPRSGSVANYRDLLNSPKWLKVITSRLMQTGFLTQYAVAVEQLYN